MAIIAALVEALKSLGVPSKALAYCALVIGVGVATLMAKGFNADVLINGLVLGATTTGTYHFAKNNALAQNLVGIIKRLATPKKK